MEQQHAHGAFKTTTKTRKGKKKVIGAQFEQILFSENV